MKKTNYLLALAALSLTVFASCKKDKNKPTLNAKEQLLTAHTWKVESITVPKITNPEVDSSITKECSLLATLSFKADKSFIFDDPNKNCDSTIVTYGKGTWKLTAANDVLTVKGIAGRADLSWKIKTLNDTKMQATFRDSISPQKIMFKTITLKK
ncbi:MAG: lipocalin family protein [Ginsengibacter sp.]